jgi:hypothetical protein
LSSAKAACQAAGGKNVIPIQPEQVRDQLPVSGACGYGYWSPEAGAPTDFAEMPFLTFEICKVEDTDQTPCLSETQAERVVRLAALNLPARS